MRAAQVTHARGCALWPRAEHSVRLPARHGMSGRRGQKNCTKSVRSGHGLRLAYWETTEAKVDVAFLQGVSYETKVEMPQAGGCSASGCLLPSPTRSARRPCAFGR